nr:peptidase S41 [Gammaproteobacteria bacterium]
MAGISVSSLRLAAVLSLGVMLGVGVSVGPSVKADRAVADAMSFDRGAPLPWREVHVLTEVLEHIRNEYVEEVSDQELVEAAIRGVMASLDPHSAYLDRDQFNEVRISTSGEYSGVGLEVTLEEGIVRVVAPVEGSPAARAGIRTNDRILAIDGRPVASDDLDDTIQRMRGATGTKVQLTVARNGELEPLTFTLERENVQLQSVRKSLLDDGIGYVRIAHFSERTPHDVERAIKALKKEGGKLKGLVLDLRDNPGGVLEAAVSVTDLFLEEGLIVSAVGRAPAADFAMTATPGDVLNGAPLVVLVNAGSASASEIVAGALRDHGRATLVGQKTYGKGSVQTVMPLSNGQALKLTTSHYFTPSGASIHKTGIVPDRTISDEELKAARASGGMQWGSVQHDYELRVAIETLAQAGLRDDRAYQSRVH